MTFDGFITPTKNWFPMPNNWTDITAEIKSLAELKVVEYVLRHTWGYHEYGIKKSITTDEFMHGRMRADGTRMDKGTGLSNRSVIDGLRAAEEHGYLESEIDTTDKARQVKYYALKMVEPDVKILHISNENLDVKILHSGYEDTTYHREESSQRRVVSSYRSEKDTIERHYRKTPKKESSDDASASHAPTPERQQDDDASTTGNVAVLHGSIDHRVVFWDADGHPIEVAASNEEPAQANRTEQAQQVVHSYSLSSKQGEESDGSGILSGEPVHHGVSVYDVAIQHSIYSDGSVQGAGTDTNGSTRPQLSSTTRTRRNERRVEKPVQVAAQQASKSVDAPPHKEPATIDGELEMRRRHWQKYINERRGGPLRTKGLCINETVCLKKLVEEFTDEQITAIDTYLATEHWKYKRNPAQIGGKDLLDESRPAWTLLKDRVKPANAAAPEKVAPPTVGTTSVHVPGRKETALERRNRELREMFDSPVAGRA